MLYGIALAVLAPSPLGGGGLGWGGSALLQRGSSPPPQPSPTKGGGSQRALPQKGEGDDSRRSRISRVGPAATSGWKGRRAAAAAPAGRNVPRFRSDQSSRRRPPHSSTRLA